MENNHDLILCLVNGWRQKVGAVNHINFDSLKSLRLSRDVDINYIRPYLVKEIYILHFVCPKNPRNAAKEPGLPLLVFGGRAHRLVHSLAWWLVLWPTPGHEV